MVVLQGLEISSGQRATFIGLVPIAVSGVLLILTGLRLTLIPRGVTQGNISVIAAAAAILVVVTVLVIVSAGASKSTRVGLGGGVVIGIALASYIASQGSMKLDSFMGGLLLLVLPLGLIGSSVGSVYNLLYLQNGSSATATVLLCLLAVLVSLPGLMIFGIVLESSAKDRNGL
jgi:hypothetical protein